MSAGPHPAHDTLEAIPFKLVTATSRDAFLGTWLTDDLIDVETLTGDGTTPGLRQLSQDEARRWATADLVFLARESVLPPANPSPKAFVLMMPAKGEQPVQVPSRRKGKKTPVTLPPPCSGTPSFSPPPETYAIAVELAAALETRLPQLHEMIERNLLFLKSEFAILDGLLKEVEARAGDRAFLVPECLYRQLGDTYHLKLETVDAGLEGTLTSERFAALCKKTGRPGCFLLQPGAPGRSSEGGRSPGFSPPGVVLNAGLRAPIRANVLADYQAQVEALRALFGAP